MVYNDINKIGIEYDLVYSDPPWKQTKGNIRKCRPNQNKSLDYKTMSMDDIKELHESVIWSCSEKHNIFIWTIDKFLFDTEQMLKSLGYKLHARFIWDKTNGVAPAFTVRFSHEYLLWFYPKGNMYQMDESAQGKYTTVLREQSTKHSKKPLCAYEMLEDMFPDAKKIELFARDTRKGWDSFGDEVQNENRNRSQKCKRPL